MNARILLLIIAVGLALVGLILAGKNQAPVNQNEDPTIIAKVKEAASNESLQHPRGQVILKGTAQIYGTSGRFEIAFSADGRFINRIESALSETTGFDGKMGWMVHASGMPRKLSSDELTWNRLIIDLLSGQWLQDDAPYTITKTERIKSGSEWLFTIGHKTEPFRAQIHIDSKTLRPTRLERANSENGEAVEFADFAQPSAITLPHQITYTHAGIASRSYEIQSVSMDPSSAEENLYIPMTEMPNDAHFDPSIPAEIEVKRAATGHFLIRAKINDEDLGWFILDSGAAISTLSPAAAAKLKLPQIGESPLSSIFGAVKSPIRAAKSLQVGPITIDNPQFAEMDLYAVSHAVGIPIEGVIGYPLFARTIMEVEVSTNRVALYDPKSYSLQGGTWQELILDMQIPVVRASFEGGREGLFRLDLGAGRSTVIFHSPAVQTLDLLNGRQVTKRQAGEVQVAVGKIAWFELAGHRFDNLNVGFAIGWTGPLADPATTGNIGGGVLVPFRVVFDYSRSRIAFVKLNAK